MRKLIAVLVVLLAAVASSMFGGYAISPQQFAPLGTAGATPASTTTSGPAPIVVSTADKWKFKKDDSGCVVSKDEEMDLMVQKKGLSRSTSFSTALSMFKQDSTQDADTSQELDPLSAKMRKSNKEVIIAATPDFATKFDSPPETLVLGSVVKIKDTEELVLSEEYLLGKMSTEDAVHQ